MAKRLQVRLFPGWKLIDGPRQDYPHRLVREGGVKSGVLDVTFAEYSGGQTPYPSDKVLVELASGAYNKRGGELIATEYGDCALGRYGMARGRSESFVYMQCWFLSNGRDVIIAEYHNRFVPEDVEVSELQQIVKWLDLATEPT